MEPDTTNNETRHINKVVRAFQSYRQYHTDIINEKLKATQAQPVMQRLQRHYPLICHNQIFLNQIVRDTRFLNYEHSELVDGEGMTTMDYDKIRSTIKQFAREWSKQGERERRNTFGIILDALERIYDVVPEERAKIKVLVPGSGLGRLPFEICSLGFACQGNEYSMFMLLASNYILNQSVPKESVQIYPWIHQFSNMPSEGIQLGEVRIPDIELGELQADFSMVGGDFVEVYGEQKDSWDCIVTCFFIDTAKNMLDYLKVIQSALKEGGIWINLGPLLYHFEGNPHSESVEYTEEEFLEMVDSFGFEMQVHIIDKDLKHCSSVYAACPGSLSEYVYHSLHFVAKKQK